MLRLWSLLRLGIWPFGAQRRWTRSTTVLVPAQPAVELPEVPCQETRKVSTVKEDRMRQVKLHEPYRWEVDMALARLEREEYEREQLVRRQRQPQISGWKLLGLFACVVSV